ncbi:hypothetical protein ANN_11562 [Periplaneta americana]|uniref:Neither inactivation nor afterpotential protein C n=1 Tax=Periplaneta americana TaxID=6978 RepID=A0ABQ8T5D1_PERAM|nr:hypothetical protein ANN_11562 [Periplaneta americana]
MNDVIDNPADCEVVSVTMAEEGSLPDELKLCSLPDPGDRYVLGDLLGAGVCGEVFEANDTQSGGKRVAIKIQRATPDNEEDLRSEYQVLKELSDHSNLPDLYGVYLKKAPSSTDEDKLWFVMELCEGGPVTDLVRGLQVKNRRMSEEHIAYILKEIVKVLVYLHENHVMHRDVKGSNILLTKDGEVKLVDFGLSRKLKNAQDKRGTYVGSPCWMAPEVVASGYKDEDKVYDSRIDVWALGITAIELADGKAPFLDMHPTRALFQIVRNPPPNLYRPANWTQDFNDFITEALFIPQHDILLSTELKMLIEDFAEKGKPSRKTEMVVRNGLLKEGLSATPEPMRQEDLAALEKLSEDTILDELQSRLQEGHCHTFVGDVLLVLNPNEQQDVYGDEVHAKYRFKARSDNAPHIFSVADKAYQDALHHEEPQYVLLAGETLAGKTTNMLHLLQHLLYLGQRNSIVFIVQGPNKIGGDVNSATSVIHALGNAATPSNPNSTRHVLQLELAFTPTGKVSGATFWLYQLEKWRVTDQRRGQANFHVFYYFYDGLEASRRLEKYNLDGGRKYRYLRTQKTEGSTENILGVREDPQGNVQKFREFEENLKQLGFQDEQLHTLYSLLAAILVLGEIRFQEGDDNDAEVGNPDVAAKVANLLGVDEKKFSWALINYCAVQKGTAVRRRHAKREAEEARDVLARGIYSRLVDWIVNVINYKLSFTRAIFGDKYSITLMDLFGFECFKNNGMEQLFVNTLNEQLQYHYNQRVFTWEMQEQEEEEIPVQTLEYYDNKMSVDELMAKPDGFLYLLDETSRTRQGSEFILKSLKASRLQVVDNREFSVAHYTGRVAYDSRDMADKNRDFLPPEMVDTLRMSSDKMVKFMFSNQLTRTGNLAMSAADCGIIVNNQRSRWGAALATDGDGRAKARTEFVVLDYNEGLIRYRWARETQGRFSQSRQLRTAAATFRGTSLDILRGLTVGPSSGGSHFVRCIRSDLAGTPRGFQTDVVRQQLRALAVLDTAVARQKGYSYRVPFPEFLRRYKFLAFDFDETVDITKDNSRLLLVRLKMEGWVIGKSKVFLKYYNEEYLARTYEIKVKKIIKVQTMMRAFLAKRNVASKLLKFRRQSGKQDSTSEQEVPAS